MNSTELKQHQDKLREALKNLLDWDIENEAKGLHILSVEIGRLSVILEKLEETV